MPFSIEDKHEQKRHATERNKASLLWQKPPRNKRKQRQRIMEQAHNDQSSTNLYSTNTKEMGPRSRGSKGMIWW